MNLLDIALLRMRYTARTRGPIRTFARLFNIVSILASIALLAAAGSFGVALGWWAFQWTLQRVS